MHYSLTRLKPGTGRQLQQIILRGEHEQRRGQLHGSRGLWWGHAQQVLHHQDGGDRGLQLNYRHQRQSKFQLLVSMT